jgi:hypothetical protein
LRHDQGETLMLMVANQSRPEFHWAAGAYPGRIGHLYSPAGRGDYPWMPYALDNGAFGAWKNGTKFDESEFLQHLDWAARKAVSPLWVLAPDVVGNREATIESWQKWYPILRPRGWPVAFAAQDGMVPEDVPKTADLVFIGGSTRWKWRNVRNWCRAFPRVHVGRVNGERALWLCVEFGAESCDGTGWWNQTRGRRKQLLSFLARFTGGYRTLESSQLSIAAITGTQGCRGRLAI